MIYNQKVDYFQLFLLFSTAYIEQKKQQGGKHQKNLSKTLRCIPVRSDSTSDGLLFYYPSSKQFFSADDGYHLDPTLLSDPCLKEMFNGNFIFDNKYSSNSLHQVHSFELSNTIYYNLNNKWFSGKIINQPIDKDNEPYLIQDLQTSNLH